MRYWLMLGCALGVAAAGSIRLPAQSRPLPVVDTHVHAQAANTQGPPPVAVCIGKPFPPLDPRQSWADAFAALLKKPPCPDPIWSPLTDDALRDETIAVLKRRNIIGIVGGSAERVAGWRQLAPERILPAVALTLTPKSPPPERFRELHGKGQLTAIAEIGNQYVGVTTDDPAFEPYLAMAESLDVPLGIHIGPGPPGAPYLPGFERYRARMHSALQLEDPLLKHPKLRVYVMHAGWPMADDLLAVLWAHRQVYVEVGVIVWALPRAEFYRYLQRIVEAGFGDRVMFGSDQMVWPGVIEPSIRIIEEAPFLNEQQKRDILYNNAARFFRFTPTEIDRHHGR